MSSIFIHIETKYEVQIYRSQVKSYPCNIKRYLKDKVIITSEQKRLAMSEFGITVWLSNTHIAQGNQLEIRVSLSLQKQGLNSQLIKSSRCKSVKVRDRPAAITEDMATGSQLYKMIKCC